MRNTLRRKFTSIALAFVCLTQAACGCFCTVGDRWGAFPTVPYQYTAAAIFPPGFNGAFDAAALTWTGVTLGTFRFVPAGNTAAGFPFNLMPDGVNSVDFVSLSFLPSNPIAGTLRTNLSSGGVFDCVIREFDIVFSSTPPGYLDPVNPAHYDTSGIPAINRYDIQTVALHELGHAMGLEHVGCPDDSIMLPGYNQISRNFTRVKRDPDGCDIAGVDALYIAQAPPCLPLGGFCFFSFFLPFSTVEGDQVALNQELSSFAYANAEEVIAIATSDPVIMEQATSLGFDYVPEVQMYLKGGTPASDRVVTDEDVKKADKILQRLHANGSHQLKDAVGKVKKRVHDLKGKPVSEVFSTSLVIHKKSKEDKPAK